MVIERPFPSKKLNEKFLPEFENNFRVDEFGTIITVKKDRIDSCVECDQLLKLYKKRQ